VSKEWHTLSNSDLLLIGEPLTTHYSPLTIHYSLPTTHDSYQCY